MDRLTALAALLERAPLDALLITAPHQVRALCRAHVSAGALVVRPGGAALLLDPRYQNAVTVSAGVTLVGYANARQYPEAVRAALGSAARRIGVDARTLTLADMTALNPVGALTFTGIEDDLDALLSVLDEAEVLALQRGADITRRAMTAAFGALRPGVTEREVQQVLLAVIGRESEGPSFSPIVAFGARTALPHAHPGDAPLHDGDLVTVDAGAIVDGLHADLTDTRVYAADGQARPHALLDLTRGALDAALRAVHPGARAADLDEAARAPIRAAGLDAHTLRGIGHAVGYETHQAPILREHGAEVLRARQVLALEPGVYLPGVGGARLEEMVVVTAQGGVPIARWVCARSVA